MPDYWLDANVFIEPNNSYYSPVIAPGYWNLLDQWQARNIAVPVAVYTEITVWNDNLGLWARARQQLGLFVTPDASVQTAYSAVANYVLNTYPAHLATDFLSGADPWIVAHANAKGGDVVTHETRRRDGDYKIKLPCVCDYFNVKTLNVFDMMKAMGVTLKL